MALIQEGCKVEMYANFEKKELVCTGRFVQFGVSYEEFETGPGNFTTVIALLPDGSLANWSVESVKVEVQIEQGNSSSP
jgi:hypothetical protein